MSVITAFKFRQVNKNLLDGLLRSQLYFAKPGALNDPYDCQVDMAKALERAISLAPDEQKDALQQALRGRPIFERINNDTKAFGVYSFSRDLKNHVLWSHYADEHRGVCLTYEIPQDFVTNHINNIFGYAPVKYGNDPLTEFFLRYKFPEDASDLRDFAIEAMKTLLSIKASDWKYEIEARIIHTHSGALEIPREFLSQICFGLRTSNRDKSLIRDLVDDRYSNVIFAELQPGESNFELSPVEIQPAQATDV